MDNLGKKFQPFLSKMELHTPFLSELVPAMTGQERVAYQLLFEILDSKGVGFLEADSVRKLFMTSGLPLKDLAQIWCLADQDRDSCLDSNEFAVAVHLIRSSKNGISILHSVDSAALLPIQETEDDLKGKQQRLCLLKEKKQQLLHLKGRKLREMMIENWHHQLDKEDIRLTRLQLMILYELRVISKEKVKEEEKKLEKMTQRIKNTDVTKERLKKEIKRLEEALVQVCEEQSSVTQEISQLQLRDQKKKSFQLSSNSQPNCGGNVRQCQYPIKKDVANQTLLFNPFTEDFLKCRSSLDTDSKKRRKSNGFKDLEEDFFRLLIEQRVKYSKQTKINKTEEKAWKNESDFEESTASYYTGQLLNNGITEKREELAYLKQKLDEIKRQKRLLLQERNFKQEFHSDHGASRSEVVCDSHCVNGLAKSTEICVTKVNGFIEIKPKTNNASVTEEKKKPRSENKIMSHYTVIEQNSDSFPDATKSKVARTDLDAEQNMDQETKFVTISYDNKEEMKRDFINSLDIAGDRLLNKNIFFIEEIQNVHECSNTNIDSSQNKILEIENSITTDRSSNNFVESGNKCSPLSEIMCQNNFIMKDELGTEHNLKSINETMKKDEQTYPEQTSFESTNPDYLLEESEIIRNNDDDDDDDNAYTVTVVDDITGLKKKVFKNDLKDLPSHYRALDNSCKLESKPKLEKLVFDPEEIEELERERKALIGSVMIRHKAIKKWNINDNSPDAEAMTFDPFKLENLRRQTENHLEEFENFEDMEIQTESLKKYLERKKQKNQEIANQEKKEKLKSPASPPAQGAVDTQSIIDNKIQTKKYWEDKMTEEKQVSTKYVEIKMNVQNQTNSQKNEKLNDNMATKEKLQKSEISEHEKAYQEYHSEESSQEDENDCESIIDREIRLALEREEKLRQEREAVLRELELSQQTNEESYSDNYYVNKNSLLHTEEYYRRPENIIGMEIKEQQQREEEFHRQGVLKGLYLANKQEQPNEDEHNEKMAEFSAHESLLEREIRMQKEKELIIERERNLAHKLYGKHSELQEINDENFQSQPPSEGSSESAYYSSAENLIAQEIRELQEREEELRQIHEQMTQRAAVSKEVEKNSSDVMTRSLSHDSISSSQDSSTGDCINLSERVKVRPYEEPTDSIDSKYVPLNETPIEREIRLLREREEALRKEQGSFIPSEDEEKTENKKGKEKISKLKINSSFENIKDVQDTQRHLATTLLQKEIEEQKQRELDLCKSGHIKTTSEEHVDIVSAKSLENLISDYSVENSQQMAHVARSVSLQNFMSKDDIDLPSSMTTFKPPSPLSPNLLAPFNNPGPPPIPRGLKSNVSKKLSHSSRGISTSKSHPGQSSTLPRKMPPNSVAHNSLKNISMEKFISSCGKKNSLISNAFTLNNSPGAETHPFRKIDYEDFTMLRISKPDEDLRPSPRRIYQTTESKIEQELRDMKEREEELRKQREWQMNLGLTNSQTSVMEKEEASSDRHSTKQKKKTTAKYKKNKKEEAEKKSKRQSALIAQWEEMIHQQE